MLLNILDIQCVSGKKILVQISSFDIHPRLV